MDKSILKGTTTCRVVRWSLGFRDLCMNAEVPENPPPLVQMLSKRSESELELDAFGAEGGDPELDHDAHRHRAELSPGPTGIQVDERCADPPGHAGRCGSLRRAAVPFYHR